MTPRPISAGPSPPLFELLADRPSVGLGEVFTLAAVLPVAADGEVLFYSPASPSAGPCIVAQLSDREEPIELPVWGDVRCEAITTGEPVWTLQGEAVALADVELEPGARPGDVLEIEVEATWYDGPEPRRASGRLELPVVGSEARRTGSEPGRFRAWRDRTPLEWHDSWSGHDLGGWLGGGERDADVHEMTTTVPEAIALEYVPLPEPRIDLGSSKRLHFLDARSEFLDARGQRTGRLIVRFRAGEGNSLSALGVVRATFASGRVERWFRRRLIRIH